MKNAAVLLALVPAIAIALASACDDAADGAASSATGTGGSGTTTSTTSGTPIPAETQRPGDPAKGYDALVNEGYVSCGIPYTAYSKAFSPAPEALRLPGRTGHNAEMPYYQTDFVTKSGVEVVTLNCLACHATTLQGKVVVGLGDTSRDFTVDQSKNAGLAGALLSDPTEKMEFQKWLERFQAIGPYTTTTTIGVNPADNLAAALFAHRDPATLAWSATPLLELPPTYVLPVNVPPWWHMAKKNAMFYVGAGRGDHARIMMTASTLCTDSVAEAQEIDAYFPDVEAYLRSLTPPAFPGTIDAALADEGKLVFQKTCSRCHGTYDAPETYPNLLVALDEVGTDAQLANGSSQFAKAYVDWFNASYYGEIARLEPQAGYVAPPLDGIWATAPYFHNGSVPTIAGVLDSTSRPASWTRTFSDADLDLVNVGWNVTVVDHGKDGATAAEKPRLYDTAQLGYGNGGHTYGDALTASERAAVIEYLKTL